MHAHVRPGVNRSSRVVSRIAADAAGHGSADFVRQVAYGPPPQAISDLLGVPAEDYDTLFDWTDNMIGNDEQECAGNDALMSVAELIWYAMQLAVRKAIDGMEHWQVDYRRASPAAR
ncbi:hypothetical protein MYSE111917_19585 [Mycobacterium senriense]